jgi:hypothetical protein
MNKEELRDVVLNKVDEKYKEIELNLARYKETGYPDYLRICTEAKGFNDGIDWTLEQLRKEDVIW